MGGSMGLRGFPWARPVRESTRSVPLPGPCPFAHNLPVGRFRISFTKKTPRGRGAARGVMALWPPGAGNSCQGSGLEQPELLGQRGLELLALDDVVEEAVLHDELGGLEALGQVSADGLAHHARPGEADQRARLGDVQVAQHGVGGRDAARGRVGQQRDERQLRVGQQAQLGRGLGHLHEREGRLHHPCPARFRDDQQRVALFDAVVDGPADLLAHHRAHRAADEGEVHGRHHQRKPRDLAMRRDDRVLQARLLLRRFQAVGVFLRVHELQRVGRLQVRVQLLVLVVIEQDAQVVLRRDAVVVAALHANREVVMVVRHGRYLLALGTLEPQAFLDVLLVLGIGVDAFLVALEPQHIVLFLVCAANIANPPQTCSAWPRTAPHYRKKRISYPAVRLVEKPCRARAKTCLASCFVMPIVMGA